MFYKRKLINHFHEVEWKTGQLDNMRIAVTVPSGRKYLLHERELKRRRRYFRTALLESATPSMLRSNGCGGHWSHLCSEYDSYPMQPGSLTEMLTAIGMALDAITIEYRNIPGIEEAVPYAIVEDIRIANKQKCGSI